MRKDLNQFVTTKKSHVLMHGARFVHKLDSVIDDEPVMLTLQSGNEKSRFVVSSLLRLLICSEVVVRDAKLDLDYFGLSKFLFEDHIKKPVHENRIRASVPHKRTQPMRAFRMPPVPKSGKYHYHYSLKEAFRTKPIASKRVNEEAEEWIQFGIELNPFTGKICDSISKEIQSRERVRSLKCRFSHSRLGQF
jgi:hypothetical protein